MPTYEYRCEACGHQFEHFQSISSPRLEVCPKCSKKRLNRLIGTGGGVIFKGSGFYQTDYRSDSYKKAAAADHGGSAEFVPVPRRPARAAAKPRRANPNRQQEADCRLAVLVLHCGSRWGRI